MLAVHFSPLGDSSLGVEPVRDATTPSIAVTSLSAPDTVSSTFVERPQGRDLSTKPKRLTEASVTPSTNEAEAHQAMDHHNGLELASVDAIFADSTSTGMMNNRRTRPITEASDEGLVNE